jgi:hypothetical protein
VFEEKTLKLQTRCHECIFAQFSELTTGNQQIGCDLGRSEKFRQQGKAERKILENVDAYEISTACTTYRDAQWLDKYEEENDVPAIDSVRDFVKPRVDFIIVEHTKDDLEKVESKFIKTINSILAQEIPPRSVVFVLDNDPLFKHIRVVLDLIDSMLIDSGFDYQLVRNMEQPVEYYRLLDVGVAKTTGTYYTHYELGVEIPKNLIDGLDAAINDSMWTVCYVEAEGDDNCDDVLTAREQIVQRSLHKLLGGNEGAYIEDKIDQLAESQQVKNKIMYAWEQLDAKKLS